MKRLSVVFVTLAVLALALTGCSNPVVSKAVSQEFEVFVSADQVKGLSDYQVMRVFVKGYEIDSTGAPVVLLNTSPNATVLYNDDGDMNRRITEMLPVFNQKNDGVEGFTRELLGYSAWFKFDVGVGLDDRALKFVAWAVEYNDPQAQQTAMEALREWRLNYALTATYENDAMGVIDGELADRDGDVAAALLAVKAAYEASGTPFIPYPVSWWLPVLNSVTDVQTKYDAFVAMIKTQAYIDYVSGAGSSTLYPDNLGPLAQTLYDDYADALDAFQAAWDLYSNNDINPNYALESQPIHNATGAVYAAIFVRDLVFETVFASFDQLADVSDILNAPGVAPLFDNSIFGSKKHRDWAKTQGEKTGHRVIYHTEADRYFPLPADGIKLYWTRGNFVVGNVGPGGGLVVDAAINQTNPVHSLSKDLAPGDPWGRGKVDPREQVTIPQIVEVAFADIIEHTTGVVPNIVYFYDFNWYYLTQAEKDAEETGGPIIPRDKLINAALDKANDMGTSGTNGVYDWVLGSYAQYNAFAIYLDQNGYSNGNLVGKFPNDNLTNYWTFSSSLYDLGWSGYGLAHATYDVDGVFENVVEFPFVFPNANINLASNAWKARVRPVMAWGSAESEMVTNNWQANNIENPHGG